MTQRSTIEWCAHTWNPVTGCTKLSPASPGCANCYAATLAERFRGTPGHYFEHGFDIALRPERLPEPLRWRAARTVFVNSMSDVFHPQVPDTYIAHMFAVMQSCAAHTWIILTKRPARMRALLNSDDFWSTVTDVGVELSATGPSRPQFAPDTGQRHHQLPHVWLGTSAENQHWAQQRLPLLADTPAARRVLSAEPLLGPLSLPPALLAHLDWVIVGGESGAHAHPMHPDWPRTLRDQCVHAEVPFFFKQWGTWTPGHLVPTGTDTPDTFVDTDHQPLTPRPSHIHDFGDGHAAAHVGKGRAGRHLDGQLWEQRPPPHTF